LSPNLRYKMSLPAIFRRWINVVDDTPVIHRTITDLGCPD